LNLECDLLVIGSGPAGQKAAVQAAKGGLRVIVCEQLKEIGGACVQYGTIPSKALRERALERYRVFSSELIQSSALGGVGLADTNVIELIGEMDEILRSHDRYITEQLLRNNIEIHHGRARFTSPHTASIQHVDGTATQVDFTHALIACGSTPRTPDNVPIDHEHVLDSDSVLSMAYLPDSMVVLGAGVIACEYASVFALLGVSVIMIDRSARPLGFLDADLTDQFLRGFERHGGRFIGERQLLNVSLNSLGRVVTHLHGEPGIESGKLLCALGRISKLDGLDVAAAGVAVTDRGHVAVNGQGQTSVGHIYAAGDAIGPPALASASMEQGRRAACHILSLDPGKAGDFVPTGIYAIPEMSSVGLTEAQALAQAHNDGSDSTTNDVGGVESAPAQVLVGRANFTEIARGHIAHT
jgi:NAD(P) transhydrogenase